MADMSRDSMRMPRAMSPAPVFGSAAVASGTVSAAPKLADMVGYGEEFKGAVAAAALATGLHGIASTPSCGCISAGP